MEVVVQTASGDAEITLGERLGAATVGAVVERVSGQSAPALLYVDGRAVPSSTFLGDSIVRNGSVIDTREPAPEPPEDALVELIQIAGPGSGARRWLAAGRYRLGPGRKVNAEELTIAPVEHGVLDIDVDPGGSLLLLGLESTARIDGRPLPDDSTTLWSGEWLDVAGRVFTYRRRSELPRPIERPEPSATTGRIIFNRPPRRLPEAPPPALVLPSNEPMPGGFSGVLRDFADRVHERRQEERTRLRGLRHHMAGAIELAKTGSPLLWRVRPSHVDAFHVPIGIADVPDVPAYERKGAPLPAAEALVRDPGALNLVPVTIDFGSEQGVGLVGDADASLAAARGALLQAVVEHGPADLDIVVATNTERRHAWEWVKWLPHARLEGHPNILTTPDQVAGWAEVVVRTINERSAEDRRASSHLTLVVVDDVRWWRDRETPLRPLLRDPELPLRYLVLGRDASEVPAACTTIVTTTPGSTGVVDHVAQGRRLERAFLFEVDQALATDTARALAAFDDPDVPEMPTTALPANVPLLPLHGVASVEALDAPDAHRSGTADGAPQCAAPIGVGANGTVRLDLTPPGEHVLIAGRRGAGTSELVRSIVLSFALRFSPDDVAFVLVDALDSATFRHVDRLPHVAGSVTEFDAPRARRLLRSLDAELRRRAATTGRTSPQLLVVIHELAAALDIAGFGTRLGEIAERGRTLGLHVIASTRRPMTVAVPAPPVAFTTHIALRLDDPADAVAATGSPDAAALPGIVGRAVFVTDAAAPVEVQTATVIAEPDDDTASDMFGSHRIDVVPFVLGRDLTSLERRLLWGRDERAATSATPDVRSLVDAIIARDEDAADVVVKPSLPKRIPFRSFLDDRPGDGAPFALADRPDEQRWDTVWWAPGTNISFIGGPASGATSLLLTVALACVERHAVDDVHLYVIADQPHWLNSLAPLPHVGAVVGVDDPERVSRLVTWLDDELHRRMSATEGDDSTDAPHIVLLVDDIGAALRAVEQHPGLGNLDERLQRILNDGPDHRISSITTALDERTMGSRYEGTIRLVAQLPDDFAYAAAGVDAEHRPADHPGRAIAIGADLVSAAPAQREAEQPPSEHVDQPDGDHTDHTDGEHSGLPDGEHGGLPDGEHAEIEPLDDIAEPNTEHVDTGQPDTEHVDTGQPEEAVEADHPPLQVEVQIVAPPSPLHGAVTALLTDVGGGPATRPPYRVEAFVAPPSADILAAGVVFGDHDMTVGIGRARGTGAIATLRLAGHAPTLVLGDDEAACTDVLVAVADVAAAAADVADEELTVFALAGRDARLAGSDAVDVAADSTELAAWVRQVESTPGRRLVLIDEAGRYNDPAIADLFTDRDPELLCVIAGRSADLRSPLHWLTRIPNAQQALLLSPGPDDMEILGLSLPDALEGASTTGLTAPTRRDRPYLVVDGDWTPVVPLVPGLMASAVQEEN